MDDMDSLEESVEEVFLDDRDDIQMTTGSGGSDGSVVEEGIDDSL